MESLMTEKWNGSDQGKILLTAKRYVDGEYEATAVICKTTDEGVKMLNLWLAERDLERAA